MGTQEHGTEHYHGLFPQTCPYVLGIAPLCHRRVVNSRPHQ